MGITSHRRAHLRTYIPYPSPSPGPTWARFQKHALPHSEDSVETERNNAGASLSAPQHQGQDTQQGAPAKGRRPSSSLLGATAESTPINKTGCGLEDSEPLGGQPWSERDAPSRKTLLWGRVATGGSLIGPDRCVCVCVCVCVCALITQSSDSLRPHGL